MSQDTIHEDFEFMLHGPVTNMLSLLGTKEKDTVMDRITGEAVIRKQDLSVCIDDYKALPCTWNIHALKLLDFLAIQLTKQTNYRGNSTNCNSVVEIPWDTYTEQFAIDQKKTSQDAARKRVKNSLALLSSIHVEWSEIRGKTPKHYPKMKLFDSASICRGIIKVQFSTEMTQYLANAFLMQYPLQLFRTSDRLSSTYGLGKKMALHYGMDNNIKRGTADILQVKTLLAVCPDIPTPTIVRDSDRHFTRRIMEPFAKALDALGFIQWRYEDEHKQTVSRTIAHDKDIRSFCSLYVRFSITNYQQQSHRLAAKAQEKQLKMEKLMSKKAELLEEVV